MVTDPATPGMSAAGRLYRSPGSGFAARLLVVAKIAKGGKLLGIVASLVAYSFTLSWQVAAVLVAGLCFHEWGHVWAMRRLGIPTSGFYLIPFVGGVCSPKRGFVSRAEEAFVASMGPVFGLAATPVCLAVGYAVTGSLQAAAGSATLLVLVNGFNLLPIVPMDGGRMLRSVAASFSRWLGLVLVAGGIALAICIAVCFHVWILLWIAAIAVLEIVTERRRGGDIVPMRGLPAIGWIAAYLCLLAAVVALTFALGHVAGERGPLEAVSM
jgi:Zn-dependent protease